MDDKLQEKLNKDLFFAVYHGNTKQAKQLLAEGADVNAKDNRGDTPLYVTVMSRYGDPECINLLIKAGANADARNNAGWVPLHRAAAEGNIGFMRILISAGADIDARDAGGWTPEDILKERHHGLYKEHIDELTRLALASRALRTENTEKPALTGFEFDI